MRVAVKPVFGTLAPCGKARDIISQKVVAE